MIPLSSTLSGALTWSRISCGRTYELKSNDQVVGTLQRSGFWSMSYQAETQGGRWSFRRAGWLGGRSEILDSSSQQPIATFKMAWGGRGGRLTFADGQTFQLESKGWWRPVWTVTAENGEMLLRLQRREKTVDLPASVTVPESRLTLLIMFTWYSVLQAEEDAASAATAATATVIAA